MKKGNVRLFCLVVGLMMILGHHFGSRSSGTTLSFKNPPCPPWLVARAVAMLVAWLWKAGSI